MKIIILGAASFIGINLIKQLSSKNEITLVDNHILYFEPIKKMGLKNLKYIVCPFNMESDFYSILVGQDILYHLASTNTPANSNQKISDELSSNIIVTSKLLDACVKAKIKKVIFISSGGTVYGKDISCPIKEDATMNPISSYGLQKLAIEKLLYLYDYQYGLDYSCIRLSNPYGPYQRPNGGVGVVTNFIYKILNNEKLTIYGDGTVVRDFIFIDDAIRGIINISNNSLFKTYNLGSGYGISIIKVLETIQNVLKKTATVDYLPHRKNDILENYLDISRYEAIFGKLNPKNLEYGISRTADFLKNKI